LEDQALASAVLFITRPSPSKENQKMRFGIFQLLGRKTANYARHLWLQLLLSDVARARSISNALFQEVRDILWSYDPAHADVRPDLFSRAERLQKDLTRLPLRIDVHAAALEVTALR